MRIQIHPESPITKLQRLNSGVDYKKSKIKQVCDRYISTCYVNVENYWISVNLSSLICDSFIQIY